MLNTPQVVLKEKPVLISSNIVVKAIINIELTKDKYKQR